MPYAQIDEFVYVELSRLDEKVMPWVPGVPAPLYNLAREEILREFCRRSGALIGQLPGLTIFAGQSKYSLEGVAELMDVLTLKRLYFAENGTPINEAAYLMDADRRSFTLQASWDTSYETDVLIPLVSLTSCPGATLLETAFFDRWSDGIAAGVVAYLQKIPKKQWTDLPSSMLFQEKYESAVANAKIAVSRTFNKYAMRTPYNTFT